MTVSRFWYLEGFSEVGRSLRRVPIFNLPFTVGRQAGLDLSLDSTNVSLRHAQLYEQGHGLMVRDLGSTNGTFLNQQRLRAEVEVQEGDILHFADLEFRVGRFDHGQTQALLGDTAVVEDSLPQLVVDKTVQLSELIGARAVTPLFQPIVDLSDGSTLGYEVLGRGDHERLPRGIEELFDLAALIGAEVELSRLLRSESLAVCATIPQPARFFFNTHPAELKEEGLLESVQALRASSPALPMTLEIHEAAVADLRTLRDLKAKLAALEVRLAYDDFGTGQARLMELAEAPPDYLKFDLKLIRDVDRAPPAKWRLVKSLAAMAHELGITLIAEGLESEKEAKACRELGFAYGQGYFYGPPVPSTALT